MSGLVSALMDGEPIPVAVVKDQQDIAHEADKAQGEVCPRCKEMPCKCGRGMMRGYDVED